MKISRLLLVVGILLAALSLHAQSQISISPTQGLPTIQGNVATATASWTSSTTVNTALTMTVTNYGVVFVALNQGSTITGGVVKFEASDTTAFTNAYTTNCTQMNDFSTVSGYTLTASANQGLVCSVSAFAAFRVRLSTVISGTATVNVSIQAEAGGVWTVGVGGGTINATNNLTQIVGNTVSTAGSGIQKVGIVGNGAGNLDAATNGANPGNQLWMVPTPTTASGAAITSFEADAVTTSTTVKSSAGNFYGYLVTNTNSSVCYLQVFNTTSPTLGTTAPIISLGVPASAAANISLHYPVPFSTAIAVASTTASKGSSTCGTGMTMTILYQ